MILESKDYFNKKINNKTYIINLVKTENDITFMIKYFNNFIISNDKKKYVGLDFEFNSSPNGKQIALLQIILESKNKNSNIFIFYPPDLNNKQINILITLLTDYKIKKILHGAEALDIPYLFKNIFITNELRNKFCQNLFDTRYMCEYMHIDNKINKKCKIYSILLELNVINNKQYNMLLQNEENMGPIYEININIQNLSNNVILYSAFDVLYLPTLLKQFPQNTIYNNLISDITCFNYKDKYDNFFVKPFSEILNKLNNFFIKTPTGNLKLIDISYYYYYTRNKIFLNLIEINYFKKFLKTFIKFIVYKNIYKLFDVYVNNMMKTNMNTQFKELKNKFKFINIPPILNKFLIELKLDIKKEIKRNKN